jgi:hypothetical protein
MRFQYAEVWGVCQLRKSQFVNIVNRDGGVTERREG